MADRVFTEGTRMTDRTTAATSAGASSARRRLRWAVLTSGVLVVAAAAPASATWSIVGADPATGEVGVAVASCVPVEVALVPVLAPGIGAAASQANQNFASGPTLLDSLESGANAEEVVATVTAPTYDPLAAQRQFGVVTLDGSVAGFTGPENMAVALNRSNTAGTATAQGNILVSERVIDDSLAAFDATTGTLADKLMAALQAGSAAGGDSRCGSRTASAAALMVATPDDPAWQATGVSKIDPGPDERPSVYLSVLPSGTSNAVTDLAALYEATPEVDGEVYAREVPWIFDATGLPPMFVYRALAAVAIVLAVVGALVWWLIRRSKRRRAATAA